MKLESHPQELTQVPFSKTECGVDFNINTDTHERLRGVLMEYPSFKTNFFELRIFFLRMKPPLHFCKLVALEIA